MNVGKGIKDVWEWRSRGALSTKDLADKDERRMIHNISEKYRTQLGLKVVRSKKINRIK